MMHKISIHADAGTRAASAWRPVAPSKMWLALLAVLVFVALLVTVLLLTTAQAALAADPTPSAVPVLGAVDSRTNGGGPGLVGSPVLVALGVIVLGLVTAAVTLAIARLTRRS